MRSLQYSFVLFLLFAASLNAQSVNDLPTVSVTGTAEILVSPDEAVFELKVEETRKGLLAAKRANDRIVASILAIAQKFEIADKDIKTDFISVSKDYETVGTGESRRRVFSGYEVSKTAIIKLRELTKFEEFFTELLQTGVSEVESVKFSSSKVRRYREEARAKAILAAKAKATALANAIGQDIGKALEINERSTTISIDANISSNDMAFSDDASNSSATFAAGTISVKVRVTADFLLK